MSLTRSATKLFLSNITKALVIFGATVIFSRAIGASGIGLFFLFQGGIIVLSLFADVGLRSSLEKRISEGLPAEDIVATTLVLKLPPLILIISGIFVFQATLNEYFNAKVAPFLAVGLLIYEIFMFIIKILNGQLRAGEAANLYVIQYVVWSLLSYVLIESAWGHRSLLVGYIIGTVVATVEGYRRLSTPIGSFSTELAYSLLRFSRFDFITYIRGQIYNWTDVLIIGYFLGVASVGKYEVAWRVSAFVLILSHAIATVIFPQMSKWSGEEAIGKIEAVIPNAITPSLFFVIPSFFGVIVFSRDLLSTIFGMEFETAWLILIILMLDKVVEAFQVIFDRSLRGLNRPDLAAFAAIVSIAANVALNIILVMWIGAVGAAIATLGASLIGVLLYGGALSRLINISIPSWELAWCTISAGIMGVVLILMKNLIAVKSSPHLFGLIGVGAILYITLVFVPSQMREKIRVFLNNETSIG